MYICLLQDPFISSNLCLWILPWICINNAIKSSIFVNNSFVVFSISWLSILLDFLAHSKKHIIKLKQIPQINMANSEINFENPNASPLSLGGLHWVLTCEFLNLYRSSWPFSRICKIFLLKNFVNGEFFLMPTELLAAMLGFVQIALNCKAKK